MLIYYYLLFKYIYLFRNDELQYPHARRYGGGGAGFVFTIHLISNEGNLVLKVLRGSMTLYQLEISTSPLAVDLLPPCPTQLCLYHLATAVNLLLTHSQMSAASHTKNVNMSDAI